MTTEELNALLNEVNVFAHGKLKDKSICYVMVLYDAELGFSAVGGNPARYSDLIKMMATTITMCSNQIMQNGDERIPRPEEADESA